MSLSVPRPVSPGALRQQADQVFRRSAGAPLVAGNRVRILRDGRENYPAWEEAIRGAQSTIHIEMYIIHHDAVGRRFVELLAERARAGVKVRVLYDWFGCGIGPMLGSLKPLVDAGGEVRVCNPLSFSAAFPPTSDARTRFRYSCDFAISVSSDVTVSLIAVRACALKVSIASIDV